MGIAYHVARINLWNHCREGARNVRKAVCFTAGKVSESCAEVLPNRGVDGVVLACAYLEVAEATFSSSAPTKLIFFCILP